MVADPTQFPVSKAVDAVAAASIVGTILGWLPYVASILSIIWFMIQIYESHTFQEWSDARKIRRRARKIARLRSREKILAAEIQAMEAVRSAKVGAKTLLADAKAEAALDAVHDQVQADVDRLEKAG